MTGDSHAAERESWLGLGLLGLMLAGSLLVLGVAFVGATYSDSAGSANSDFATDVLDPASELSAGPFSLIQVTLNWTATPDTYAAGYRVMRAMGAGPFTEINTVTPAATTTYNDNPGLLANGTYHYYVIAFYEAWNSVPSNTVTCMKTVILLTC